MDGEGKILVKGDLIALREVQGSFLLTVKDKLTQFFEQF